MVPSASVTDSATYAVDALPSVAPRTRTLTTSRRSPLTKSATLFVVLAFILAVGHFVFLLSDYKNVFVHPDFHQANLGFVMRGGLSIGSQDFINILQQRWPNEFRPRWLMFYLETLDHKIRMQMYEWMPVYPTLGPVTWPLQLLLTPYLLYRLLVRLTDDRLAALAAVAVYMSATGFLSGFTMALMPGKTLTNLVFIGVMYAAVAAADRIKPGEYLAESGGPAKYLLILALTLGLFLDELPAAAFLILLAFSWRYILPQSISAQQAYRFVKNGLFLSLPIIFFLLMVLVIVPPITEKYLGYRFDYLADILPSADNNGTGRFDAQDGPYGSLTPAIIGENFTTLFGLSLAPGMISPLVEMPWGEYPGSQVNNLPKLAIFLVFFGAALLVAVRARGTFGMYFRGLLVAITLFLGFLSLLSIRHIPVVTGFYYGACFASLFAILVGMMLKGVSLVIPSARPYATLAVIAIVATQIINFWPINEGWKYAHNEIMARARIVERGPKFWKRYPLEQGRPLTATEVNGLWDAWQNGRMPQYIQTNKLAPAATYVVFELREIDRHLGKRRLDENEDDDD